MARIKKIKTRFVTILSDAGPETSIRVLRNRLERSAKRARIRAKSHNLHETLYRIGTAQGIIDELVLEINRIAVGEHLENLVVQHKTRRSRPKDKLAGRNRMVPTNF